MADITRDVKDVRPLPYVRPGVVTPSPLSLAANLGEQGMELDKQLAKEKLRKQSEGLRTIYETSAPGAQAVQDAVTPEDQRQVDSLKSSLAAHDAAVQQGRMSYDEYRVRGERLLRQAISKRPGLASEFRGVAAAALGVDVVGASVDVLASWERQVLAAQAASDDKDKDKGPDFKRMRDQLDAIGVINGHMTEEQTLTAYEQNQDAVVQFLRQQAENEVVTTGASSLEATQKLRRPGATAEFVTQAQKNKLEIYRSFSQAYAAFQSGQMTPTQMATVINNGQMDLSGRISSLRAAMAQGDVDPAIAEKEITGMEELGRQMESLSKGELGNDVVKNRVEGIVLYMQNAMLDNESVAVMSAATKTFSPEIMREFVMPGGAFNKTAMIALGDTLNNTGQPKTKASQAGSIAGAVISRVLDRGGAKSNPEMVPAMGQTLINSASSFVEMDVKDFKSDWLTGPTGYLTKLHTHREALAKSLGAEQTAEVVGSASMAAMANYQALAVSLGNKYPSLASKVEFRVDPVSGDMVRSKPGVVLTPTETAALRQYNKAFAGKMVIQTIQAMAGVSAMEAVDLFHTSFAPYKQAKEQAKKAKVNQADAGSWWENL